MNSTLEEKQLLPGPRAVYNASSLCAHKKGSTRFARESGKYRVLLFVLELTNFSLINPAQIMA
ncbi:MAG: hypothetical protein DMG06_12585 [Acidobacteria bacterium]|nr:MAG: hypothetical protein DMG06_12585 [Acidobacteriota bacterium]